MKYTVHDEISYAEHNAWRNGTSEICGHKIPENVEVAVNNFVDYIQLPKIMKSFSSFNGFWKCRECCQSYSRKKNGEIDMENY